MLIAVLEQHGGLRLADRDVFASSVGGIKVGEPASDLALLLAIAGAHYRRSLDRATIAVGEVGLGGEIRGVPQLEQRVREAARLGYTRAVVPPLHASEKGLLKSIKGLELIQVRTVSAAIEQLT
jgi:DNA repair protein RadA/Sms